MTGYDFTAGKNFEAEPPVINGASRLVIVCDGDDVHRLMRDFRWDEDTVEECTNLDETVRFTSYRSYDFISLIYVEADGAEAAQREINLFFSREYLVMVLPKDAGVRLGKLTQGLSDAFSFAASRPEPLSYLYYFIFDSLTADFSDSLEALEDEMEALSEAIEAKPGKAQSLEISRLRKTAYTYKKLLRATSYIGGHILMDENKLLETDHIRYFRSIDTRLIKLYDFADNLFTLSNELLHTYDSKFSAQMNETVNKLTVITLFFGPLTVIAGIYGMNFTHMPELKWAYGYPAALGLMLLVSLAVYLVLKKKKWI